jgi:hypothetical protein
VVICLGLKLMRSYPKLTKEDTEVVHPVLMHIFRPDNKGISQLHERLRINFHLGAKILGWRSM